MQHDKTDQASEQDALRRYAKVVIMLASALGIFFLAFVALAFVHFAVKYW